MCTEVNLAMGLQATAATKRKHELTFDGKDANTTYTSGPPPQKTSKWSINNNYIEATDTEAVGKMHADGLNNKSHIINVNRSSNSKSNKNNNNNDDSKNCNSNCTAGASTKAIGEKSISTSSKINNGDEFPTARRSKMHLQSCPSTSAQQAIENSSATTPLPPDLSLTSLPEDSIAKLTVVASAPCEPWGNPSVSPEPVDCISKLQAVAVPSDPWGSIATRSTLATTLLSADELDDDDDDFEDDYEEDESIIPTYCPLRYHPFTPASNTLHQPPRLGSYSPTHSYGSRPNYYSEPFPQQNCSRTGSAQHMRLNNNNGFTSPWQSGNSVQHFYIAAEASYATPPPQQQTIRCAENGKSYLELGCSSPPPPNPAPQASTPPLPPFNGMHIPVATNMDARHALKRCCDGRSGNWCSATKHCYKDVRLKIRNLSMFKLSRFRQVSEQSLYRSVLICNTLKRIDREIEAEAKEMHQAAAAVQAHMQQQSAASQYHQLQAQLQQHHGALPQHVPPPPPPQHIQSTSLLQQQQQQQPQQQQDYSSVLNCARISNMDYQPLQSSTQFQTQQQQQPNYLSQQHDRLDTPPPPSPYQLQKTPVASFTTITNLVNNVSSNCDVSNATTTPLHPYDHYPFRESQSGRATPFPCHPVTTTATTTTGQISPLPSPSSSSVAVPSASVAVNSCSTSASNTSVVASTTTAAISPTNSGAPISGTLLCSTNDTNYTDEVDSSRSINWSSVLNLSSQSALDPLNNNDLFSILPPATSVTSPATAVPVPLSTASSCASPSSTQSVASATANSSNLGAVVSISSTNSISNASASLSNGNANSNTSSFVAASSAATTATFTTLCTISSATHSLTASYVSHMNANAVSAAANATSSSSSSTWEYGFLDMEFGLGSEFTELLPSCKLSNDDLFKNGLTPVATTRYSSVGHDNELEQPAHIMVGS